MSRSVDIKPEVLLAEIRKLRAGINYTLQMLDAHELVLRPKGSIFISEVRRRLGEL